MNNISSAAVAKATGRTWDEWIDLLDQAGASQMDHRQIVRWLHERGGIQSGWWCQMVTVGYEKAKGRRIVGQTANAGFEVGVHRTLPIDAQSAWKLVTSGPGVKSWLGTSAVRFVPKETYRTADGTTGEIRTVKDGERIRLTWQPKGWKKPSTLQLTMSGKNGKTRVGFHHEKLANTKTREKNA